MTISRGPCSALLMLLLACTACAQEISEQPPEDKADTSHLDDLPIVFEADFENGSLERWAFTDDKAWDLASIGGNSVLALTRGSRYRPEVRSPRSIAWAETVDVGSFILDLKVKQTGREYGHRDSCIFFGKQDASHFYYVHIASVADPHAHSIFLVNGEPRVSIAEERTNGANWTEDFHHVRIIRDIESGLIEVYMDDMDVPIMRTHDKTFTSGPIGVGSFDDEGQFDEIVLRGESPNPAP